MAAIVGIAEAKAHLSDLVDRAERGEEISITRHGKPVARLVPSASAPVRPPLDIDALRAFLADQPIQSESAASFVRRMRDDARY